MRILPGDLDITLRWKPERELTLMPIERENEVSSHAGE